MWRARSLIALALSAGSLASGARAAAQGDAGSLSLAPGDDARRGQVLAQGAGFAVTVGEVEDLIRQQGPGLRARYRDGNELRGLVTSLVRAELLANEASRRGYDTLAPVRYLAKDSAAQALVRSEVDDKITPETIAEADVRAYYDAHPAEFHRVAMRRASVIVLASEAEAEALVPEAHKADPRAFAELAKQHSKDPETKVQGGDLGYFAAEPGDDPPRDKTQPLVSVPLRQAVFLLADVGDTSKPVALATQRALVRFTAERPERHVSLEDAAPSIRGKLWRERRQKALDQLVNKLRARDKPQVFTDRIYQISFDDMEKRPSGFAPDPIKPPAQEAARTPRAP
jgi:peptidyl-prolyl cis-trans isomerase C